jgi:spore maturation protein CgeB
MASTTGTSARGLRVLVVDTYYPAFLESHYAERPGLAERPYAEQLASLIERGFGTSDAYSFYLRENGHEARDTIVNCLPLQRAWAREHGAALPRLLGPLASAPTRVGVAGRQALLHAVALAQIRAFRPDVVYLQDLWFLSRRELDAVRRRGVLVAGQIASQAPPAELLRGYDLLLTSFPHYVERFRRLGIDSEYLRIAFDERVTARLAARGIDTAPDSARPHDAVFVGGVNPAVHHEGTRLLELVADRVGLDTWGYGADALEPSSALRRGHKGEAWGLDMFAVLAGAKIALNRHIDAAEGHANNMRLYETTGTGALLATDRGSNLGELFEPGREVVVYDGADDLVEKVRHYLAHDAERLEIARAGQARTLREHTYAERIAELAEILEARVNRR